MKIELLEELVYNIIKRLDELEKKQTQPQTQYQHNGPKLASKQQLDYLRGLGGKPWINMSSKDASVEIDKLLRQQKEKQSQNTEEEWPELEKPTKEEIERVYDDVKEGDYI